MKKLITEEFIKKAKLIHGDTFSYNKTNYYSCAKKVIITCKIHGDFEQIAGNHLHGLGCRNCSIKIPRNKKPDSYYLDKANKMHNLKYNYSETNWQSKIIEILCPIHGKISCSRNNHLAGSGCGDCWVDTLRISQDEFIRKSKVTHKDKYNYSRVVFKNVKEPVIIICPIHGEYTQRADSHLYGKYGCNRCAVDFRSNITRKPDNYYLNKSLRAHGNKYNYIETNWSNEIIDIICPTHGKYSCSRVAHMNGAECFKCYHDSRKITYNMFIQEATNVHGDTYLYDKLDKENFSYSVPVSISCRVHGLFSQTPESHCSGAGCIKCASNRKKMSAPEFFKKCIEFHGQKYNYSKSIFNGLEEEICITCNIHGDFIQIAKNHTKAGCQKCSESHGEKVIRCFLEKENIYYKKQYVFNKCKDKKPLPFDFFLPYHNMLIEFNGRQHYEETDFFKESLPERQYKDKIKSDYCKDNNIPLLIIPHWDIKNVDNIIRSFIFNDNH